MKRLLATLMFLTILLGTAGAVWAQDFDKGLKAYQSGDFATALKEWKPLAEQGNASAQHNLGFMYRKGKGVTQDYAEAVKWYRKAAEQGHASAQNQLGFMYYSGKGVTQDYAEAVKWYRKAAEQGYAIAQYFLGQMYDEGKGVTQDYAEAVKWYRKSAEQGDVDAKDALKKAESALEAQKEKIAREKEQKLRFTEAMRLAEQGDAKAQLDLSEMYYSGEGVAQDHVEAVKWARKAADQGAVEALMMLGYIYESGEGEVTQDYAEAMKWYRKAAEQGSVDAEDALERVAAKMSEFVLRDFLIRSDVQDLETLANTIESKCNKKPKCAFDKVWNYIDKTGDRKLSLAEISRFQRNLIKLAAHKKGGDLKLQEILGLNLTTILFAPITASSILHSFDYNNDDYLSKEEVFGDTEFAKLVGIDQNALSSLANFDELSEELSKYMKKLPF